VTQVWGLVLLDSSSCFVPDTLDKLIVLEQADIPETQFNGV
jgi:hypothetical protein